MDTDTPSSKLQNPRLPPEPSIRDRLVRAGAQRWVWLVGLSILAIVGYLIVSRPGKGTYGPGGAGTRVGHMMPPVPVTGVAAKLGDLNHYLTAIGSVTAFNTVTVMSRVPGEIMKVAFTEGQIVKAGELLLEIDPRPYQIQLEQAQGTLAKDQASLTDNKILLARDEELFRQHVIARQDLDNQRFTEAQFEGAIISDEAAVDSAKLELTYSRVTAPIGGKIGLRLVDPGNVVTVNQGLIVITQVQPIAVRFSIPEDDLPQVVKDMGADPNLPVEAWDRDFKVKLAQGTLLTINNQIDQTTGTILLKAVFQNLDGMLFPNQFVNARLLVGVTRNSVLIPVAAVQRGNGRSAYVFVVNPNKTAQKQIVTVAAMQGDAAAIATGLQAGEVVVTDGVDKLRTGALVNVHMASNNADSNGGQQ
ncbi:MAG TPA: MdtA/MuxA family multidrug efflux RND transporter periplasmic adaptor subunit [Candidatus Binataceae bacterium]|nr:MdtA/MuxA family multidrug efflux RND transporter periplasmic adaptor subunit [Candidatus Binataceae bacterium]